MTLEASLIMPIVICVIVLIIYFAYYLYGRCVLSQDTYILAFRASSTHLPEYAEDKTSYVYNKADEKLGKKYFGSTKPVINAETNGKEVLVRGYANIKTKAMGNYFLKPKSGWDYMAAGRAKDLDCIRHIRKIKRYKDIGERLLEQE